MDEPGRIYALATVPTFDPNKPSESAASDSTTARCPTRVRARLDQQGHDDGRGHRRGRARSAARRSSPPVPETKYKTFHDDVAHAPGTSRWRGVLAEVEQHRHDPHRTERSAATRSTATSKKFGIGESTGLHFRASKGVVPRPEQWSATSFGLIARSPGPVTPPSRRRRSTPRRQQAASGPPTLWSPAPARRHLPAGQRRRRPAWSAPYYQFAQGAPDARVGRHRRHGVQRPPSPATASRARRYGGTASPRVTATAATPRRSSGWRRRQAELVVAVFSTTRVTAVRRRAFPPRCSTRSSDLLRSSTSGSRRPAPGATTCRSPGERGIGSRRVRRPAPEHCPRPLTDLAVAAGRRRGAPSTLRPWPSPASPTTPARSSPATCTPRCPASAPRRRVRRRLPTPGGRRGPHRPDGRERRSPRRLPVLVAATRGRCSVRSRRPSTTTRPTTARHRHHRHQRQDDHAATWSTPGSRGRSAHRRHRHRRHAHRRRRRPDRAHAEADRRPRAAAVMRERGVATVTMEVSSHAAPRSRRRRALRRRGLHQPQPRTTPTSTPTWTTTSTRRRSCSPPAQQPRGRLRRRRVRRGDGRRRGRERTADHDVRRLATRRGRRRRAHGRGSVGAHRGRRRGRARGAPAGAFNVANGHGRACAALGSGIDHEVAAPRHRRAPAYPAAWSVVPDTATLRDLFAHRRLRAHPRRRRARPSRAARSRPRGGHGRLRDRRPRRRRGPRPAQAIRHGGGGGRGAPTGDRDRRQPAQRGPPPHPRGDPAAGALVTTGSSVSEQATAAARSGWAPWPRPARRRSPHPRQGWSRARRSPAWSRRSTTVSCLAGGARRAGRSRPAPSAAGDPRTPA